MSRAHLYHQGRSSSKSSCPLLVNPCMTFCCVDNYLAPSIITSLFGISAFRWRAAHGVNRVIDFQDLQGPGRTALKHPETRFFGLAGWIGGVHSWQIKNCNPSAGRTKSYVNTRLESWEFIQDSRELQQTRMVRHPQLLSAAW